MTNTIKTIAASIAAFTFVGTATAQEFVDTTFNFDRNASAAETYEIIRKTASNSCDVQLPRRASSYVPAYQRAIRKCRNNLVEMAVRAIDEPSLTALHEGRASHIPNFASND